jgi:hypothetical protein
LRSIARRWAVAETRDFPFPSFDEYFKPIEEGAGSVGAEFVALPEDLRRAVKQAVYREIDPCGSGGAIAIEVAILFASGTR